MQPQAKLAHKAHVEPHLECCLTFPQDSSSFHLVQYEGSKAEDAKAAKGFFVLERHFAMVPASQNRRQHLWFSCRMSLENFPHHFVITILITFLLLLLVRHLLLLVRHLFLVASCYY